MGFDSRILLTLKTPRKHWERKLLIPGGFGDFLLHKCKEILRRKSGFCVEIVPKLYQFVPRCTTGSGEMFCDFLIHFGLLICEGTFVDSVHDVC